MPLSMGEQSGNGATAVTVWLCVLEAAFNNMKTHMSRFWGKSQLHTSRMEDESSDRFPECFTRFLCLDSHYVQNDFHFSWRVDGVTRRHCSTVTCWQVRGAYSTCCCALRLDALGRRWKCLNGYICPIHMQDITQLDIHTFSVYDIFIVQCISIPEGVTIKFFKLN